MVSLPAHSLPVFILAMAAVAVTGGGCVSAPTLAELKVMRAPHLESTAPAGLVDGRAAFRGHFGAALASSSASTDTETWLLRLDDERGAVPAPVAPEGPIRRLHLVLVTGAFAECLAADGHPFRAAVPHLRQDGHRVETLVVGGRSGTEHNARQIAEHFEQHPELGDLPLVLIGYSKGTNDILGFLDHFPALARSVSAVVGIAGPVSGSPIADRTSGFYSLFSHLPTPDCPVGDGDVVHSLRTDVRRDWMARARLPATVRYYSIVAIATRARVARTLAPAWRLLLRHDRRNDGQVLARDALLPHSTVLGYLQADHWEVALDLEEHRAFAAHREDARPFPRLALLRAIGRQIGDDLGTPAHAGRVYVP